MGNQTRIVHVVPLLFGPGGIHGGAERYAYDMALATSERFETKLITFGRDPSEWKATHVSSLVETNEHPRRPR